MQRDPVTELTKEVVMKRTIVRGDVKRDKQVPQDDCQNTASINHADELVKALTGPQRIASAAC